MAFIFVGGSIVVAARLAGALLNRFATVFADFGFGGAFVFPWHHVFAGLAVDVALALCDWLLALIADAIG